MLLACHLFLFYSACDCREAGEELQGAQSPASGHILACNYVQSRQLMLVVYMHGRTSFALTLVIQDWPLC